MCRVMAFLCLSAFKCVIFFPWNAFPCHSSPFCFAWISSTYFSVLSIREECIKYITLNFCVHYICLCGAFVVFLACLLVCKPIQGIRACVLSHFSWVPLFVTLWTVAHQVLLSMGFSRQEYWNGLPCPSPGNLLDLGIELASISDFCIHNICFCGAFIVFLACLLVWKPFKGRGLFIFV